jgi:hypothetical protein
MQGQHVAELQQQLEQLSKQLSFAITEKDEMRRSAQLRADQVGDAGVPWQDSRWWWPLADSLLSPDDLQLSKRHRMMPDEVTTQHAQGLCVQMDCARMLRPVLLGAHAAAPG